MYTFPSSNPSIISKTAPTIIVGFDFGTNTSCIIASHEGSQDIFFKKAIPTLVGYPKSSVISGILESDKAAFFGTEVITQQAHLDVVAPLKDGIVHQIHASKDFVQYIKTQINPNNKFKVKAVVGIPANTDVADKDNLREVTAGNFDEIMLVPEPFLAAMGYRNEKRLKDISYIDPAKHSLFIDIGAGTTDLCLIQGYYPEANDLITTAFAGDRIDQIIMQAVSNQYPEVSLSLSKAREIKEKFSYVGPAAPVEVKVLVGGKSRQIEVGAFIAQACNQLLQEIFKYTITLIGRCPGDSVENVLQNIIITGGGCCIKGIHTELQKMLIVEGFENPKVSCMGEHYKAYVGLGAWKIGMTAKSKDWQKLLHK